MFKKQVKNVPDGCVVFVNGKRVENSRRIMVNKDDIIFFIYLDSVTSNVRCSAKTLEHLPIGADIQISVSIKDDTAKIQELIKKSGTSTYSNIRTLCAKDDLDRIVTPALVANFITFAQQKNYLEFQKGNLMEAFSKTFTGQFPEWMNFNIKSFQVFLPKKEAFDENILVHLRTINSDPELIAYVDGFLKGFEMLYEEEAERKSDRKKKDLEREAEEERIKGEIELKQKKRERDYKSLLAKLDQQLEEQNADWDLKFKSKTEELKENARISEEKDREFARKLEEDDVQSERKQKEDDALSEIQRKTQQSEADNKNIIDQAKAEAEAIKLKTKAEAEAVKLKTEAEAEAIENERKGLDIFTKKAEIQSNANAKIINGLSSLLGNMKNMKGVFLPDYTGVHTIINGSGRENKNDDFLLSMFKGILVKYLDAELETELKTVSRKKNV